MTYELCIMRHGPAVERGDPEFADDAKRPLTPEGQKKVKAAAPGLLKAGFEPDWIVTSPLVRAVETAEAVADGLGTSVPVDSCDALRPGGTREALFAFLASHSERKRVIVVGHEPDLTYLAGGLIGAGRNARLAFKKGGCCLVEFDEFPPKSGGLLTWWLTPRLLRKLA